MTLISGTSRFILHMVSNGSAGTSTANLNVIETNPFKHLTHLSLKFLPGSDSDIKKYLADCLKTLKVKTVNSNELDLRVIVFSTESYEGFRN